MILTAILPCLVFAVTLTVKQDDSGDYTSIQAALGAANPGDTVLVHPGRYYENLTINRNNISLMSLEGTTGDPAYIESTIIDGGHAGRCILLQRDNHQVHIRGFTITNGFTTGGAGGIGLAVNTASILTNLNIHNNSANTGGGLNIGAATVSLSGVHIDSNYALSMGGGLYAASGEGYTNNITFDPTNRCSIYNNRSGAGQDIYIQNATNDLYMPLDTFSIAEPSNYYATYLSVLPVANNFQINFDILHAHHQEIDSDVYISTSGNDNNDGLSPANALKTIHEAIYRVAADSLNQKTVHILPGEYSRTDNDQVFPIAMKSWVIVQGSGMDTTTVIGEPHPEMGDNSWVLVFSAIREEAIWLSDLSITSRNVPLYSNAIDGTKLRLTMNFKNLRIYNMGAHDNYTNTYRIVYLSANSKRESIWNNVTIENIAPDDVHLIQMLPGILDNGEITGMKGKFSNCTFRNASSTYTSTSVMGMPLISITGDKRLEFENCVFENLSVEDEDANVIQIGGIQFPQQQNHFSFNNCLFNKISSHDNMILVVSSNNPRLDFTNCTFADNQGDAYTLMVNGEVNIVNCIFDNDTPYQIKVNPMDGNPSEHTNISIDHSLVKDGVAGILPFPVPGNTINFLPTSISGDPLFAGGNDIHNPFYYSLSALSPCIDSGTRDTTGLNLPPYDLAVNCRIWNDRIDMGCYEYGSEPWVSNDDPVAPELKQLALFQNYPNPFNPTTSIRYSIEETGPVSLDIYNIKGQLVKTLYHGNAEIGSHTAIWNGLDNSGNACSSGVYFYRLKTPKTSLVRKMLMLK